MDDNRFLVPAQLSSRFTFFDNFGFFEMGVTVAFVVIGLILSSLVGGIYHYFSPYVEIEEGKAIYNELSYIENESLTDEIVLVKEEMNPFIKYLIIGFSGLLGFGLSRPSDATGGNLLFFFAHARDFSKKQKRYLYKHRTELFYE